MTSSSAVAAPSTERGTADRLAVFDTLKAVASQLIVLHHLVAYGPLAEAFRSRFPQLADWLYYDGRLAVQVFFDIGGFLAARALAPALQPRPLSLPAVLWKRYRRLALPCMAAVLISVVCAAIARALIDDPSLPGTPSVGQLLAHALLLQDIVGVEALSAGVWYVAIDFQLYAMAALLVWLASHTGPTRHAVVLAAITAGVAAASLFVINRDTGWDVAGPYYFGVYALGAAVCWLSRPGRSLLWGAAVAAAVLLALTLEHRERVAFAGCVALLLWGGLRSGLLAKWPDLPALAFLGRISFSVFLIHYPVAMLVKPSLPVCGARRRIPRRQHLPSPGRPAWAPARCSIARSNGAAPAEPLVRVKPRRLAAVFACARCSGDTTQPGRPLPCFAWCPLR